MKNNWIKANSILKDGGVIVAPTDTIYGLLGCASAKDVVERIYTLKGRDEKKPLIVLIHAYSDLKILGITITNEQKEILGEIWPGKVSVVLPSPIKNKYLHRGTKTIAFRMIGQRNKNLYNLIKQVGPLVAPSANPQGKPPAENTKEAKQYFGDKIDLYISCGTKKSKPSTLIEIKKNKINILRQGSVIIKN